MTDTLHTELECIDGYDGFYCKGAVEYRSLPWGGGSFPRCDVHYNARLEREFDLRDRYPDDAPADFDPYYAGESWDDDY